MLKIIKATFLGISILLLLFSIWELVSGEVYVWFCHRGLDNCYVWITSDKKLEFFIQLFIHFGSSVIFMRAGITDELKENKTYKNYIWRNKLYKNRKLRRR